MPVVARIMECEQFGELCLHAGKVILYSKPFFASSIKRWCTVQYAKHAFVQRMREAQYVRSGMYLCVRVVRFNYNSRKMPHCSTMYTTYVNAACYTGLVTARHLPFAATKR